MKRRDFLKLACFSALSAALPAGISAKGFDKAGSVPILMYHSISNDLSRYARPSYRFVNDLRHLYLNGYRLARLDDIIAGACTAEKPVVLTFDDARRSQFWISDGKIDEECAVGLLDDFCREHPDFGKAAVFYVTMDNFAFGQKKHVGYKLNYLLDSGYEIGNHTFWHEDMAKVSLARFKENITKAQEAIEAHIGNRIDEVTSFCFPYGSLPKEREKWDFVKANFRSSATCTERRYKPSDSPYRLPRIEISRESCLEKKLGL